MANQKHLAMLKQGVEAWNGWRNENPEIRPNLSKADLTGADLRGADFSGVDLSVANLRGADLAEARLFRADLTGADLVEANLCGAQLFEAELAMANLRGTKLFEADLRRATCREAKLTRANLNKAKLDGANLVMARLSGADLSGANLSGADLSRAIIHGADLRGANLHAAIFSKTALDEADFTSSITRFTVFASLDLSQVKGLDNVEHHGPSSIGVDTIYYSQGKIPEAFIRGAGVGDEFIALIRGFAGGIQFYSCFISYSGKDQLFAERLYADLQAKGVRCWFAPHDVQGGKKLHEQIDEAIQVHERLLLILSPHSINSEWVKTEIAKARKREVKERRRMLFPVRLEISFKELQEWECFDADTGKDSAREIREYYIPDFTAWETPARYKEEFDKLLRDLKKAENTAD